ncbi:hypothetical protein GmHk_04G011786 [Glycine max]|nr:hypothetical protein GmHk_04G011786 [Glycine max]
MHFTQTQHLGKDAFIEYIHTERQNTFYPRDVSKQNCKKQFYAMRMQTYGVQAQLQAPSTTLITGINSTKLSPK